MANASKQTVTRSLAAKKHPLTFTQLPTFEGMLPNVNEGICHRSFAFAVPSTYPHFRQTNAFVGYMCMRLKKKIIFYLYMSGYSYVSYLAMPKCHIWLCPRAISGYAKCHISGYAQEPYPAMLKRLIRLRPSTMSGYA